jgi:branched-subunit amino acid aminotransferase/4-amino-4-deoxychorismate lyase
MSRSCVLRSPLHNAIISSGIGASGCFSIARELRRSSAHRIRPRRNGRGASGSRTSPVDERDPFLFNKTTRRAVYEKARAAQPDLDDVILWNSRGEVTEATIANVVAEIDGARYIRRRSSAGCSAAHFAPSSSKPGRVSHRVMTRADVAAAPRLWLINSLREWVKAQLV